jgi:hypothetical protein
MRKIYFLSLVVVSCFFFAACSSQKSPAINSAAAPADSNGTVDEKVKASLKINTGEKNYNYSKEVRKGSSALDLLRAVSEENKFEIKNKESSYGVFIESIMGIANDAKANKFWMYDINGKSAEIGASAYIVKDGDMLEWKYIDTTAKAE